MQLTIRTKVIYGFLILAFGMMLTDVFRLASAHSSTAISRANSVQQARRF